jgi:excisionase family DNA binding protein
VSRRLVTLPMAIEERPWLTERWLRRLVAERRVPFHKVGGRLLFDLDDLDKWAEAGRVEPAGRMAS